MFPRSWVFAFLLPLSAHAEAPDPRFGIAETFVNPAAATEAGAGYTRIILRWDVIQPAGPDDWKPANVPDPLIEGELAAGRQVVGLLIGTPLWACDASLGPETCRDSRAVPDMNYWAAFARRMAQQYRGRISRWIIWNEPDVWDAAHPGSTWAGSVEDYARLLKTAYLAIKDVDPSQQVLMAGQTYFWDWSHGRRRYLDRLLDAIVADPEAMAHGYYFDAVPYHLYFNPSQTPGVLAEARAALKKHGISGKELWINETNAPPSDDRQEPPWSGRASASLRPSRQRLCFRSSAWRLPRGPAGWNSTSCATAPTTRSPSSPTACCVRTTPRGRHWPRIGWQPLICAIFGRPGWRGEGTWSRSRSTGVSGRPPCSGQTDGGLPGYPSGLSRPRLSWSMSGARRGR